ncbi:MAG TPA: 4-hydroxybutyrate CoA-transferase, partial [Desulforhopalus sp.]|nr:4-hydroxybutyrate CoA-transferase [Desulforhopalus sp.]
MSVSNWRSKLPREKIRSAAEAVALVNNGCRLFLGTGCGEPQHLIHALVANQAIQDIVVYQMLSHTLAHYVDQPGFSNRFSLKLFFISEAMRRAAFEGKIDYLPMYLSQIPKMFTSRRIALDVAMIQVSPPDQFGYCSLGVSVDITRSALESAGMVIAQVNPNMPRTWGDSLVSVEAIDHFVPHEEPLVAYRPKSRDDQVVSRIGHFVAQLIRDG